MKEGKSRKLFVLGRIRCFVICDICIEENRIKIYVQVMASWNFVVWIDDNWDKFETS